MIDWHNPNSDRQFCFIYFGENDGLLFVEKRHFLKTFDRRI